MFRSLLSMRRSSAHWQERQQPRHQVDTVQCEIGWLVDLSRSGMRLRSPAPPPVTAGQIVTLHLEHPQGLIDVTAVVRWRRRMSLKRYEFGFQFLSADPDKQHKLEQLARFGFVAPDQRRTRRPRTDLPHTSVDLPDYYGVLGVSATASHAEIRKAFHAKARDHHPDMGGGVEAFNEIQRAWEILKDGATRRSYDQARAPAA